MQDGLEALQKDRGEPLRRDHPRHHDAEDGRPGGAAAGSRKRIRTSTSSWSPGCPRSRPPCGDEARAPSTTCPSPSIRTNSSWWCKRALERRRLLQENLNLKSEVSSKYRFENIIGVEPADAGRLPPDRQVRADQQHRPDHRRERHRQGTDRPRHPLQQPAQGQALRRGRLQLAEREPAGKRVVRPRQGFVHRRGGQQEGHVRGRGRRHAVPGRDRQHLPVDPGQAAARHPGAGIQGGRRHPDAERQLSG